MPPGAIDDEHARCWSSIASSRAKAAKARVIASVLTVGNRHHQLRPCRDARSRRRRAIGSDARPGPWAAALRCPDPSQTGNSPRRCSSSAHNVIVAAGWAVLTAASAAASPLFECRLRLRIDPGGARTRPLWGEAETTHHPSRLRRPSQHRAHPGRHTAAGPQPTIGGWSGQRACNWACCAVSSRGRSRVGTAAVADPCADPLPIAPCHLADPVHRVPGAPAPLLAVPPASNHTICH